MMDLSSMQQPVVEVGDDSNASAALQALGPADFVVVTSEDLPVTVLSRDDLAGLSDTTDSFAALADRLPPLAVIPAEPDELSLDQFGDLAELCGREGISGALVEGEGYAVVSRRTIAEALSIPGLNPGGARYGTPDVASFRFVCRKCAPPSYLLPRTLDGKPPTCRRVFFHGEMERV